MNQNLFVRCVGIGTGVYQKNKTKSYDHRLICILNGKGQIYIENERYDTEACQMFFIKPGVAYRVCCSENQEIAVINFDTSYEYASYANPILSVDANLFDNESIIKTEEISFIPRMLSIANDDLVLLYRIYDCYLRGDLPEQSKRFCLSAQLSYIISRGLLSVSDGKPKAVSSEIYKYIIDNSHSRITVYDVAEHFSYSSSFIEKALRKNYKTSFRQLVIETRLKKALWLLENTDLSCAQISCRLGFSSGQHFSNAFAKRYGKRPSEYR